MQMNRAQLIEELTWRLLESVDMETLEQFFQDKHREWYEHSADETLIEDARALGILAPEETPELTDLEVT